MSVIEVSKINRKLEKKMIIGMSVWEIVIGLVTAFIYAPYVKANGFMISDGSAMDVASAQILSNNLFTVTFTMGMFSLVLGCVNLYLAKVLKHDVVENKLPIWFMICGVIFFFMMDIVSVCLLITVSIFILAKNKAIKVNHDLKLINH